MKYLFSRMYEQDRGAVYDTLWEGVLEGEAPNLSFRVADVDLDAARRPAPDMVLPLGVQRLMLEADASLAGFFAAIKRVEIYQINPAAYPPKLDDLVIRDDFETRVWRKLKCPTVRADGQFCVFRPPVFFHPDLLASSDATEVKLPYKTRYEGEESDQEKEVSYSPAWLRGRTAAWVSGGYFLSDRLFEVLSGHLLEKYWVAHHFEDL